MFLSHYKEPLPINCPPVNASEVGDITAIRLWKSAVPSDEAFASHEARGLKVRGDVDPCTMRSCSLFVHDDAGEQIQSMRLLPKFRNFTHAFIVALNKASGMMLLGQQNHLDVWFYDAFNPVSAVVAVTDFHNG